MEGNNNLETVEEGENPKKDVVDLDVNTVDVDKKPLFVENIMLPGSDVVTRVEGATQEELYANKQKMIQEARENLDKSN